MSQPFAHAVSVDYSDDELDALATAFLRADLARRPDRVPHDAVRRAQQQTALRGLVARRAIALGGTASAPRITFFEPHATVLGAFLNAGAVATIRTEKRGGANAASLFAHDDVVVHQVALQGQQIQRLTAHPRGASEALLASELWGAGADAEPGTFAEAKPDAGAGADASPELETITVPQAAFRAAVTAIDAGRDAPADMPGRVADLLFARLASGSITFSARDRDGGRAAGVWTWIDAGQLGFWQLFIDQGQAAVRLVPTSAEAFASAVRAAWDDVLTSAAAPAA